MAVAGGDPDRDGHPDPDRRLLPAQHPGPEADQRPRAESLIGRSSARAQLDAGSGAPTSTGVPTASTSETSPPSESRSRRSGSARPELRVTDDRQAPDLLPAESLDLERIHPDLGGGKRAVGVVLVDRPRDRLEVLGLGAHAGECTRSRAPPHTREGRQLPPLSSRSDRLKEPVTSVVLRVRARLGRVDRLGRCDRCR